MSTNRFTDNNAIETNSTDPGSPEEPSSGLTRRRFLQGVGATVGLLTAPVILQGRRAGAAEAGLFSLGVASGDPGFHSAVLWTRLAPDPLNGGGMPNRPVLVRWEVATDASMRNIVRQGATTALARNGHTVHVLVAGLSSDRWFFYQFRALGAASRIGRTRTFPRPSDGANRFALASCQDFREGFYTAYRDMAEQNLDFVIHVGDYIYEGGLTDPIAAGRNHNGPEIVSVDDYRNRYALYRLDPDLQDAHALFPFIVTWDDHEVDNNYAGLIPEEGSPTQGQEFITRRRNGYQVYAEMMPLRTRNRRLRSDSRLRLFRTLRYGDLADIYVLDTRQFRTDQPAEDGFGSTDPDSRLVEGAFGEQLFDAEGILDPSAQLLGVRQEAWLARRLEQSRATWNVLAQQVMVTKWNLVEAARQTIAANPQIQPHRETRFCRRWRTWKTSSTSMPGTAIRPRAKDYSISWPECDRKTPLCSPAISTPPGAPICSRTSAIRIPTSWPRSSSAPPSHLLSLRAIRDRPTPSFGPAWSRTIRTSSSSTAYFAATVYAMSIGVAGEPPIALSAPWKPSTLWIRMPLFPSQIRRWRRMRSWKSRPASMSRAVARGSRPDLPAGRWRDRLVRIGILNALFAQEAQYYGVRELSNMRVLGRESETFWALHRPEAPSFEVFWRLGWNAVTRGAASCISADIDHPNGLELGV